MFFSINFDELRIIRAGVAVINQDVAGREQLQGSDPGKLDIGQFVLVEAPDDLSGGCDFEYGVSVAGANQGVAVFKSQCGKNLISEGLDTMSGPAFAVEQWDLVFPCGGAIRTVFANNSGCFVANEEVAIFESADEAGIVVGVGFIDLEWYVSADGLIRGDSEEPCGAGFGNECGAVSESLESMDFDASLLVIGLVGGVVFPDGFSGLGVEFDDAGPVELQEDVSGGQDVQVVEWTDAMFPAGAAIFADDGDALFGGVCGDE